ncbi:GPI ethanolamine phosphate transferas-like protein 2 [Amniculicola lignicola CBS 123094]|uniref:GPI ethanolamine phosphate transferase 2 n=1 Tax=Amniculicola lignicola CBS 123094 TaxID=1392246 RepID=A0A6A5WDC6_9PLEO|nr:GPI ethanolamine phosphate transferas-like protein 2 [Amniculicola lignicola CBS 123094]
MARADAIRLALANLLIPISILIFATGFFPYKPFMPGLATYEELGWEDSMKWEKDAVPEAQFDRIVFMVVDALRSDFVFGKESGMEFVHSLIIQGSALPFTAHATSPTITMPRVKAMTTGSIPSFLDVILNFAESDTSSTLATQDTWLAQLKAKNEGKLVMYGDDTWLKLFPDFFERADGTSSFFVSDFTEVDNNVTRHVPEELANRDWNGMVMHYLGLDHIGHKAGPLSPNMVPKQREMDDIVKQIWLAMENDRMHANTLLVLCGDHGMNEGGNHGGSAPGETSPALVFISRKMHKIMKDWTPFQSPIEPGSGGEFDYYRTVEQNDIVPTLAGLLGFPVPRNNLGVFVPYLLNLWDDPMDRMKLLLRNAKQVKKIVEATFPSKCFVDTEQEMDCTSPKSVGDDLACKWQNIVQVMSITEKAGAEAAFEVIYNFLYTAQDVMSTTASNYNVSRLFLGTSLAFLSLALSFRNLAIHTISLPGLFFALTLLLYGILMFASSYVEEEHHFWYWATSAWFFTLFISSSRKSWFRKFIFHPAIMLLFLLRIARRWNQTGQKYAGAPDIVHSQIFKGGDGFLLWTLVGATYMDLTNRLSRHVARSIADPETAVSEEYGSTDANRVLGLIGVLPLTSTAFIFKLAFTARDAPELTKGITSGLLGFVNHIALVPNARLVFGGIALSAAWLASVEWIASRRRKGSGKRGAEGKGDLAVAVFDLMSLFLVTQTRAQNIPLYLLFRMMVFFLSILDLPPTQITLTTLLLTQTSFFLLGNSNAISSIDLSNSYNGISDYNISAVGTLVFLSNWAGPIYFSLAGLILLGSHGRILRHVAEDELEQRDWVKEEREHLRSLVESEERVRGRRRDWGVWRRHVTLLTAFVGSALVAVMGACLVLRTHLFIWTVFSPKFLFAVAWGVAWHWGVSLGLGAGVWWVGGW